MVFLLVSYLILFCLLSILYIVLESLQTGEIDIEKDLTLPIISMTILKMTPTVLTVLFVIFSIPEKTVLYILLPITLFLFVIGDLFMEIKKVIGAAAYGSGHLVITSAYLYTLVQFKEEIIARKLGFSIFSSIIVLIVILGILLFTRYISKTEKTERYEKYRYLVPLYDILLSLHLISALLLTFIGFKQNAGIIVISIGIICFWFSDKIIFIREFYTKPKNSVIIIMSTYYLALLLISLQVLFPL